MGQFGSGREEYKNMTPAERSGADMQDRRPRLYGENRDTFIGDDGKCFFMSREVSQSEYDDLISKYEMLVDHVTGEKINELEEAA